MATKAPEPVGGMEADGTWTKATRIWIPELSEEARIRVATLRQDLDIDKQAALEGRSNLPDRADRALNQIQSDICGRVFAGILMLNQFLDEQVGIALQRARGLVTDALDADLIKDQITAEVDRAFQEHRANLVNLRSGDLGKQRELRYFRHDNRLRREAHYKESMILVVGFLMLMFVGESVLNGSLLSQILAGGMIEGAIMASVISLINIVAGLAAGLWGWRLIGHRQPMLKGLGVAVTMICHGLALGWNLLVAHFREVAEAMAARDDFNFDVSHLGSATTAHIQAHGLFGIESVPSWALLLLGLFIHLYAAKEGWDDVADRYLDYKKYDQRARRAHDDFEDGLADLRDEAREAVEAIEARAKASVAKAGAAHAQIAEMLDLALQRRQEVRDSEDEWVAGGNELLKAYREVNIQIRDAGSAPAYFKVFPTANDYKRRAYDGDASVSSEVAERGRSADGSIQELTALKASSKKAAEESERMLKDARRQIAATWAALDRRIEDESLLITQKVEEELRKHEEALREGRPPANENSHEAA